MTTNDRSRSPVYQPAEYRICVRGRLDPHWSDRLQGMSLSTRQEEDQVTITELSGRLPDQAALMGVLQQLYINGIPLLSMECLSCAEDLGNS